MYRKFLDVGDGGGVLMKNVVAVIDAENATVSKTTRDFLKKNQKNAVMPKKSISKINSIIITSENGVTAIYSSPVSAKLIKKRANEKITNITLEP